MDCKAGAAFVNLGARLRTWGELVAFSHTLFAMPFAASALVLAHAQPHVPLTPLRALAILACMVFARTAAMAFNRYADRNYDALNPRTSNRHIPTGRVSARGALILTVLSSALFLLSAASLGEWPAWLSPAVLAVLLGYSFAKRWTWAVHVWLGVALALAPGGVWLAYGAAPHLGIVFFMMGVCTWLLGFDILYALQDEAFDRAHHLHSIPARFGTQSALIISAFAHFLTALCFWATGVLLHRGVWFRGAVVLAAVLLLYEHLLVGKGNLSKINKAFFDVNAYVSVGFFFLTSLDEFAS